MTARTMKLAHPGMPAGRDHWRARRAVAIRAATFWTSGVLVALGAAPALAAFAPVLEWSWTSSAVLPSYLNVMTTPSVIDLDKNGVPDVVFASTSSTGGGLVEVGVLRALAGNTGSELFTVSDPALMVNATSSVATGDIDGDGKVDIIATAATGRQLIAFNSDGTFKWRSASLEAINWGAPALADLDHDGRSEIIIGRQVLRSDGTVAWTGAGGNGSGGGAGPLSIVADIDRDGSPEVVAGNTVYAANGAMKAQNAQLPDGYTAVADFDGDGKAEIVLVGSGKVWLLNGDLAVKWGPVAIPGGGYGGAPTIADFDGDGQPEIGVAGASRYVVLETSGTVKWTSVVQDSSSNRTGSSVFDFEADGKAEVVYADELVLRVFNGSDGATLFETAKSSCTWYEYPVIADVDGSGSAEIVGVANNNCGFGAQRGVYVWGDESWVDTRPIWNEHSYHITNVAIDGSIPADEQANWLTSGLNNFRLNEYLPGEGPGVPEPSALALMALALLAMPPVVRRRR